MWWYDDFIAQRSRWNLHVPIESALLEMIVENAGDSGLQTTEAGAW